MSIHISDSRNMKFNEEPFEKFYEIAEELGNGQFAIVRRVVNRITRQEYAAKFIKKRRYATSRRGVLRINIEREITILKYIADSDNNNDNECLNEYEASIFIKQLLLALKFLHHLHIVHLDIKPENVMLVNKGDLKIKLIDFGLSRRILPGTIIKDMVGTPEFVAPEVVNYEPLTTATDMWALGVVTYILLSGGSPFLGENREETFINISAVNYNFNEKYFSKISPQAKDFIKNLFVKDIRKRATVNECLLHPWIRHVDNYNLKNTLLVNQRSAIPFDQIRSYKIRLKWQRAIEIIIVCNKMTANARLLLQSKNNNNQRTSRFDPIGETCLHISASNGYYDLLYYLYMKGASLTICDYQGDTPLYYSIRNGHINIVDFIISQNIDINYVNKNKETALHIATRYAQLEIVLLLLQRGANIELQDQDGETVLHISSWHGYTTILSAFCKYKPNPNIINKVCFLLSLIILMRIPV
ncbi:unnamed protein product [Dracunculus medinensis]|uniref:Protein kinase domain-containing protein n=1 Tax=Dracunculus medinensis TaxID=318479 RepID=A0A0N4UHV1_DRAME|nr:unnamed protein product [Dracunculus medinensis]